MPVRNIPAYTEQTLIPLNNELTDYQRPVSSKNMRVQTMLTANMLDDDEANNFRRHFRKKNVRVQTDLSALTLADEEINGFRDVSSKDRKNAPVQTVAITENIVSNRDDIQIDRGDVSFTEDDTIKDRKDSANVTEQQILTTTAINYEIEGGISPILGYADEPILPLADACTPLTDLLHNCLFYVQLALSETPEQPPDQLTVDESAAIRLYTIEWDAPYRSLYSMLNFHLKNNDKEKLVPYFKYIKLLVTGLVKLPCIPPLTVWRGVTKNLSAEFPPGTKVTWWAFSSCTTEMTVLENNMYLGNQGDRTLFSVEVMNGRTIKAHSHFVTEDEILLFSGTHMVVQSQLNPAPELYIIHLKQIIPEEITLEPPFEGIFNICDHSF
ncbi:unnamed protein product [Adineta steineri]|uniref:NAD(P)(+)--arginine ADP-ribosyltransferase n=1 Tax=Adineta steineri TaxID=433720 RepID=A0A815JH38_9BILA|nr:unnamed protein product [Adineta steineri]CAF1365506.1 unnamed protein product [Adineta steineri]CAF1380947.1 unnamed protein product [Adineta steineri]